MTELEREEWERHRASIDFACIFGPCDHPACAWRYDDRAAPKERAPQHPERKPWITNVRTGRRDDCWIEWIDAGGFGHWLYDPEDWTPRDALPTRDPDCEDVTP